MPPSSPSCILTSGDSTLGDFGASLPDGNLPSEPLRRPLSWNLPFPSTGIRFPLFFDFLAKTGIGNFWNDKASFCEIIENRVCYFFHPCMRMNHTRRLHSRNRQTLQLSYIRHYFFSCSSKKFCSSINLRTSAAEEALMVLV